MGIEAWARGERLDHVPVEVIPDAVVGVDSAGVIAIINRQAEQLFGYERDELLGRPLELLVPDARRSAHRSHRAAFFARPRTRSMGAGMELHGRRRDGSEFPAEISLSAVTGPAGLVAIATVRDVSERLARAADLRRQTETLTAVLDGAPIGTAVTHPDGRFMRVNSALCELLGYPELELLASTLHAVTHPGDLAAITAQYDRVLAGAIDGGRSQRRFVRRDGATIWARVSFAVVGESAGHPAYLIAQIEDITAERASADALARLAAVVESSRDAIITKTLAGVITTWNSAAERIYGYSAEDVIGHDSELLAPSPAHHRAMCEMLERVGRGENVEHFETSRRTKGGAVIDVSMTMSPVRDARGVVTGASTVARDITVAKRHTGRVIAEAQDRFRRAFDHAPIGMALADLDGRFLQVNQSLCAITGYTAEELCARSLPTIIHPDDAPGDQELTDNLIRGTLEHYHREQRFIRASGEATWVALDATVMRDPDGQPQQLLAQVVDITERRKLEQELRHLAGHDPLTGLLNRRSLEAELDHHVAYMQRYGDRGALLLLDLDHFKAVNDTLGHSAGDQLIISVAGILRRRLRASDTVARLGGDEFAILLPEVDADTAHRVAQEIVQDIRQHAAVLSGHQPRHVTASIGVALLRAAMATGGEALVNADLAMYDAKETGRDRLAMYASGPHSQPRIKARLTWIDRIRGALDEERFELHAQPILDLRSGHVGQYELLLRMLDEHGVSIPPGAFIYIAERYDLIQEIDRWVVGQAIELLAQREAAGHRVTVEVNVSGRSLGDEALMELIESELRRTRVDPAALIFEVTETAAVANIELARQFAQRLGALGCRFALDDFGAGFGSFYYLKHLPFDYLKIDGEFVTRCTANRTDQLVIASLVSIARGLRKHTIAEGVESSGTRRFLVGHGVDYAQGFEVGYPAPLGEALNRPADH